MERREQADRRTQSTLRPVPPTPGALGRRRRPRRRPAVAAVAAALAGTLVAAAPLASAAARTTATWRGARTAAGNRWSAASSWAPKGVPKRNETLRFPLLARRSPGYTSVNDLSGLAPRSIALETPPAPDGYHINGRAIALGVGGLRSTQVNPAPGPPGDWIGLPVTLRGSQRWSVTGFGPALEGPVSGSGAALTVDLGAESAGSRRVPGSIAFGGDVEVGPLRIVGAGPPIPGTAAPFGSAIAFMLGKQMLNAGDGHPVSVVHATLAAAGRTGPLTLQGSELQVGIVGSSRAPAGELSVHVLGGASFDGSSTVLFSALRSAATAGTSYAQLSASGTVDLGGAELLLFTGCAPTLRLGDELTLVRALSVTGTFTHAGTATPVTSGDVIAAPAPVSCMRSVQPRYFKIDYSATVVTATVVAGPIVSGVAPSTGPAAGGTRVTITGSGFSTASGATSVTFGAKAASGVSCTSSTSCTAVAPAGSGTVAVTVLVGHVPSYASASSCFTYSKGRTSSGSARATSCGAPGSTLPSPAPVPGSSADTAPARLPSAIDARPVSVAIASGGATSLVDVSSGTRARVAVPAGALPGGTVVTIATPARPQAVGRLLPEGKRYLVAFAIAWSTPTSAVPRASRRLTLRVDDARIRRGDPVYALAGHALRRVGTATAPGVVVVRLASPSAFVLAQPPAPGQGGPR